MGAQSTKVSSYSSNLNIQSSYNVTEYNATLICNSKCEDLQSNIYVIIENSEVGNITFDQECNSTAECNQTNDLQVVNSVQVANSQVAAASASNEESIFPYVGAYNDTEVTATSRNYSIMSAYNGTFIMINMNCNSTSANVQENIFVVLKDSKSGDITFSQKGDASLSCQSINSAKVSNQVSLTNDQTAESEASNTVVGFGLFGLIFIVIIILIIAGVAKGVSKKKKEE